MNNSKTPLSRVTVSRKVPFLSEVLYFPTTAFTALLHVVTKPLGLEPAASMVISGGLFGMVLIPTGSAVLFLQIVERTGIWPNATNFLVKWVCVPFFILYSFKILVLDKTHLQVEDANPATPRNWLEEMSRDFFYAGLEYFPMKCIPWSKDAELPPTKQYVIASHPHGIHCFSLMMFTSIGSDFDMKFPGLVGNSLTGIVATVIFKIPIVRELFLFMGYVDASRSVASQVLAKGRSLFVCTGGEEESMYTEFGKDIVVLKKRKGFIRLALSYGADLVPVYGLGVSDLYTTYTFLGSQRRWIQKKFGIALPIFHGRCFSPLPYRQPINVLIGKPIETPKPEVKGKKPDDALVDEYHQKYIQAVEALYSKHMKDRELIIR